MMIGWFLKFMLFASMSFVLTIITGNFWDKHPNAGGLFGLALGVASIGLATLWELWSNR